MSKSFEEAREERDNFAAKGAVEMARKEGKRVGIGMDDLIRVEAMVERIKTRCLLYAIQYTLEAVPGGQLFKLKPQGEVYVFAADVLEALLVSLQALESRVAQLEGRLDTGNQRFAKLQTRVGEDSLGPK